MANRKFQFVADIALVLVTLVWGATFVAVKDAIKFIEPYYFMAIRFGLATMIMLIISNRRLVKINRVVFLKGLVIGGMLFAGYALQTFGLKYTTASNAGFITGLSVVLVPIFLTITTRRPPALFSIVGVISATVGLGFLTLNNKWLFNYGDLLVLFCAVAYALHILLVGKYSPKNDSFILATVQIATVAVASFVAALFKETAPTLAILNNNQVWSAILITAVFATALAFFLQTWVQKYTSATHTAVIFTTEPVFAALFAWLIGGESFTLRQGLGAVFILAGMLASELGGQKEVPVEIAEDTLKI